MKSFHPIASAILLAMAGISMALYMTDTSDTQSLIQFFGCLIMSRQSDIIQKLKK